MKKIMNLALTLVCGLCLVGCNQAGTSVKSESGAENESGEESETSVIESESSTESETVIENELDVYCSSQGNIDKITQLDSDNYAFKRIDIEFSPYSDFIDRVKIETAPCNNEATSYICVYMAQEFDRDYIDKLTYNLRSKSWGKEVWLDTIKNEFVEPEQSVLDYASANYSGDSDYLIADGLRHVVPLYEETHVIYGYDPDTYNAAMGYREDEIEVNATYHFFAGIFNKSQYTQSNVEYREKQNLEETNKYLLDMLKLYY